MSIDMNSVGNRIKQRRIELNMTQKDIYERCGLATGALSKIENGERNPSVTLFYDIARSLDCNMEWLLIGENANSHIPEICESEEELLKGFRELSEDDQDEILAIIKLKLRKARKSEQGVVKLSASIVTDSDVLVG